MYYFEEYQGPGHSEPQHAMRDRASQSYDALRETLSAPPPPPPAAGATPEMKQRLASSVHPRILTWREGQPHLSSSLGPPQPPSASAAHTLKLLLDRTQGVSGQGSRTEPEMGPIPSQPKPPREAPSAEEVSTLLQQHTAYAQQLESENRYVKEELAVLRLKLSELVDENKRLHGELKTTVVHEILREGGDTVKFMGSLEEGLSESLTSAMNRHDYKRWQVELERLSRLHSTKCNRLETQLEYSKSEVTRLEQVVEDLKSQLRMQDSIPTHDNGMAGGDFVFSASARTSLQNAIDRVSKERDEMCERVAGLTAQNQVLSQREEELYQQVKRSIALVEQAQLEQTEAMVQKEQLGDELARMRERFEQHVLASQAKTQQEREAARQENLFLIEDLNKKLTEQTSQFAVVSEKLEKEVREKAELSAQLLELKGQLRACDREVTIAAENYRAHSTNATLQRSSATQEADRLRGEYQQLHRERDQERKILQTEAAELKRRLQKAEHDLLNAKEECLHLTNNSTALERELHLAKLAREGVERGREQDLKAVTRQAREREEKLRTAIDDADDKHSHQVHEMDSMLHRQNKLIMKLREECKRQAVQIDKITKKYRAQNTKLKNEADSMKQRLERTLTRLTLLEEQAEQHGHVHNKMAARVKAMDDHAQNQATQLIEILAVNSRMTRDRQLLAKEVEFLRNQLSRINTTEVIRLNSSSKPLVDDILNALTKEERDGNPLNPALKPSDLAKTAAEFEDETEAKEDLELDA